MPNSLARTRGHVRATIMAKDQPRCIWCLEHKPSTLEHIFPESLGCPRWLVLEEGVCGKCNNGFGNLDQALLKPFEPITVLLQIPRKGGKPPTIDQHASFMSLHSPVGPQIYINREKYKIAGDLPRTLAGTNAGDSIIKFEHSITLNGKQNLRMDFAFRFDRKAVRSLFKTALELIAFNAGHQAACDEIFDPIRLFVRRNKGDFLAVQGVGKIRDINSDGFPVAADLDHNGHGTVKFEILGLAFECDFDPSAKNAKRCHAVDDFSKSRNALLPNT